MTAPEVKPTPAPSPNALEVIFATDHSLLDGRFIDNAWLQEAPDPVTKLTWDNAAQISPITAKELGIYDKVIALEPKTPLMRIGTKVKVSKRYETGEGEGNHSPMIDLAVNGREIRVPVLIAYGHADNAITLPVGYGQAADDGRQGAVEFVENEAGSRSRRAQYWLQCLQPQDQGDSLLRYRRCCQDHGGQVSSRAHPRAQFDVWSRACSRDFDR